MRILPLPLVVVAVVSCGPGPQPDGREDIGGACGDSLDCGKGLWCDDAMPGGYCTNSCANNGQCVGDSMCIDMNGRSSMCAAECATPGGQSTCRDGYSCFSVKGQSKGVCFPDGTTFSYPSAPPAPAPKSPIGSACAADSTCGSGACYGAPSGWPGGYCSKACSASNGCGANAVCLTDTNYCVALCASPGAKSTCRDGYVCRGFSNRTDGFCTPAPKATSGAACTSGAQCSDGICADAPGGYCTRTCNFNSDCASGTCLNDVENNLKYCVGTCPSPGSQSTCRSGYQCLPFAAPRTDGYCDTAPTNPGTGGGAGGGGGSGGGGGGGGGGATGPTVFNFQVTGLSGTWSGNAVNVVSAARTDTLAMNTCTFAQPMLGNVGGSIAQYGSMSVLSVRGTTTCPAGTATSTAAPSCTSQTINTPMTQAELTVEVTGWTDDAPVIFKMRYAPHGLPGCNYANVIMDAGNLWGIEGMTTVGKFRAGSAFDVRFVGAKALYSGSKSSDVSWDFTLRIQPN